MQIIEIMRGATYSLESHGNAWAYAIYKRPAIDTSLNDSPSVWFQDEDATIFRMELDAIEKHHPEYSTDRVLQALWDLLDCASQAEIA